jgi:hypothetical protein
MAEGKGRLSDENRMVIYAKQPHRTKIDELAEPLGIPIDTEKMRHRSAVVRTAVDHLYEKHFPAQGKSPLPYGLSGFLYPANGRNYNPELASAEHLTLVFNDMKMWLPRHLETLRGRLQEGRRTDIFVLHPENPFIKPIADVSIKKSEVQQAEIGDSIRLLCDGMWDNLKNLRIYGHRRFNTYSAVMTEKKVMAIYYPIEKRYNAGFVHVYERGIGDDESLYIYKQFEEDLAELARDCEKNVESFNLIELFRP